MSPFTQKIFEIVRVIPPGKVVSYGQIAAYIGSPRAARQVGWTLRQIGIDTDIPWWRVINQKGRISIDGNLNADRDLQKKLLQSDGIEVKDFLVDMKRYRFVASGKLLKKFQMADSYSESIEAKFNL